VREDIYGRAQGVLGGIDDLGQLAPQIRVASALVMGGGEEKKNSGANAYASRPHEIGTPDKNKIIFPKAPSA